MTDRFSPITLLWPRPKSQTLLRLRNDDKRNDGSAPDQYGGSVD